ncbi:MAG: hypothetical protein PUG60_12820 [Lachnospiraceae bacterium]|nr:hypothetical protein [Lachnospiraceae bacterium]MDY4970315.1 hypothetical protein [Lachnospiraceae bacterium]
MKQESLTLTTVKNGKPQEWITVIEDGIPVWVAKNSVKKHELMEKLDDLFHQAIENEDDEPVVEIYCRSGADYQISYFPAASLYLCEELEGRYATLSTLVDAIWELLACQEIQEYRLL